MAVTTKSMNQPEKGTETVTAPAVPHTGLAEKQELERLRQENADLRAQLGRIEPEKVHRPSFGLSEGERQDLVLHGTTNSPWTGERLTAEGEGVERKDLSATFRAPKNDEK